MVNDDALDYSEAIEATRKDLDSVEKMCKEVAELAKQRQELKIKAWG